MSTQKRYWFSARQVTAQGTRYHSGWCRGSSTEQVKFSAIEATSRTRELNSKGFTPIGDNVEFTIVADNQGLPESEHDDNVIEFTATVIV